MDEETVEQIQIKIAFLEKANADLSDVVFRQQKEIRALGARLEEAVERLGAQSDDRQRLPEDERPPHY